MKKSVLALVILLIGGAHIYAQEENVLSLYIYNFTRYIDWPAGNSNTDFVIDIIGHKSVYEKLKNNTNGRKAGNRNIIVRYLESANAITRSDILFVGFWQSKDIAKIIDKVGNNNTLLISEKDGLIDAGVGINFIIRNDVIKFEIKPANIQKKGLKITDELLKLAYKVY
jgi:hypothetical protein